MIIKKNMAYSVDDTTDVIIRAVPDDAPQDAAKPFFIVDINTYNEDRTHYIHTSHVMTSKEVRKLLGLKKGEAMYI